MDGLSYERRIERATVVESENDLLRMCAATGAAVRSGYNIHRLGNNTAILAAPREAPRRGDVRTTVTPNQGPPETPVAMNGVDRTDFDRLEELAATNGPHLVQSPVRIVVEPCWDDVNPPPTFNGFG
ncbi:hypothetical protein ISCGN_028460 [Ixodes scapularis]